MKSNCLTLQSCNSKFILYRLNNFGDYVADHIPDFSYNEIRVATTTQQQQQ